MRKRIIFYSLLYAALWILTYVTGSKQLDGFATMQVRQLGRMHDQRGGRKLTRTDKRFNESSAAQMPESSYFHKTWSPAPFILIVSEGMRLREAEGKKTLWVWVFGRLRPMKEYSIWKTIPYNKQVVASGKESEEKKVEPTVYPFEWLTDIEQAKQLATQRGLMVLVRFDDQQRCKWSKRLEKEICASAEFQSYAAASFVSVSIDCSENGVLGHKAEQNKYDEYQKLFAVEGYPTIVLLNAEGVKIAETGLLIGDAQAYIEHLNGLVSSLRR